MRALTACLIATLTALATSPGHAAEEPGLLIEDVLAAVKDGLAAAQSALKSDAALPPLDSVELILETTLTKKAGGGFNLWVLSVDGKIQRENATRLTLRLKPPVAVKPVSSDPVRAALAGMIVSAVEGTHRMYGGPTPLALDQVIAELKFVVERSGEGGVKFTISPVTFDLAAGLGTKAVQTIKVTFARKP